MTLLRINQVSKTFTFYENPIDRLKDRLIGGDRSHSHKALNNISFSLSTGESVAILGKNGAGKSTLLKLITRVLLPDSGTIDQFARLIGLLELGTGFDANLTGRENIRINGLLLGMSETELYQQSVAIIAFAELGEYIDHPVRTYSSGMMMRLGFSIAIHANPACFIVDEALSVGDVRFQQKCITWMKRFQEGGGSLLFVSHDLALIKQLCQRAIVLHNGHIAFDGSALNAANYYETSLLQQEKESEILSVNQQQDKDILLLSTQWQTNEGLLASLITGKDVHLKIILAVVRPHDNMSLGFMIRNRLGQDLFGINTKQLGIALPTQHLGQFEVDFPITLNLGAGEYVLFIALHDQDDYTKNVQLWQQASSSFTVSSEGCVGIGQVYCPVGETTWRHV